MSPGPDKNKLLQRSSFQQNRQSQNVELHEVDFLQKSSLTEMEESNLKSNKSSGRNSNSQNHSILEEQKDPKGRPIKVNKKLLDV